MNLMYTCLRCGKQRRWLIDVNTFWRFCEWWEWVDGMQRVSILLHNYLYRIQSWKTIWLKMSCYNRICDSKLKLSYVSQCGFWFFFFPASILCTIQKNLYKTDNWSTWHLQLPFNAVPYYPSFQTVIWYGLKY